MPTGNPISRCGVYEIKCLVNGRVYVGSSSNLKRRLITHRTRLRSGKHHNIHLQRAFDLYGEEQFEFYPVLWCPEERQYDEEQTQFAAYSWDQLFNMAEDAHRGAGRHGRLGQVNSPEHRAKISAALKGRPTWNKGVKSWWSDKLVATRIENYDHLIEAEHKEHGTLYFTHQADAARYFEYKRKRVNESIRRNARTRDGWAFRKVPKSGQEVCYPNL